MLIIIFAAIVIIFILKIGSFLAINKPVDGEILVVEGWFYHNKHALKEAMEEFNNGNYVCLVTLGGPDTRDSMVSSVANRAAEKLVELGFDDKFLVAIPSPYVKKNRTYNSALVLKEWFMKSKKEVKSLNVFTLGVHARKSYVLFRKVMGQSIAVGVIAAQETTYNQKYWWLSMRGIRLMFRNTIGYIYALA